MSAASRKRLIVNADDFGLSAGVNRGIIRAHEEGIVTSASLMVRYPAAAEAAEYARRRPALSVGLHLDLGEWVYRGGGWAAAYEVVPPSDAAEVAAEVAYQLRNFGRLVGREPTHLDSHQHAHRSGPLRTIAAETAARLGRHRPNRSAAARASAAQSRACSGGGDQPSDQPSHWSA